MFISDLIAEALGSIRAHALRSFLTLLGIIIGVATIVGVVSVIAGLDGYVREKVIVLSPDVFLVTKFGVIRSREEFLSALKRRDIDWNDYQSLSQQLIETEQIAAQATTSGAVKFRDRRLADLTVFGTTANYPDLFTLDLAAGRYFIEGEARTAQRAAVIGWDIKEELFPRLDPIGRELTLDGFPYRVIGVVSKRGSTLGQPQDNRIYLPLRTFQAQYGSRPSLEFLLRARGGVPNVDRSVDEARAVLRALRHTGFKDPDPFGIVTAEVLQTLWRQVSGAAFMLMMLISSVSLGVGGIVIMNIMLVSVVERTQEIGLRKAVGAQETDILVQFVLEATLLSIGGGILGAALGGLAAVAVRNVLEFPSALGPGILALGLGLSALVGIVAGWLPARNASRLDAIKALGFEK
ncbi:MAG TPA: ABC transporter permease [Candidatus Polarisedimenticolia bacterium]|nr:ABC transporter permease [Candidatus Polarisedimenticolia bacterium]